MIVDAGVAVAVSSAGQLLLPLPSDQDFTPGAGDWLSITLAILDGMLREVVSNEVHELGDCQLVVFWGPDRDQATHWSLMPIHGIDQQVFEVTNQRGVAWLAPVLVLLVPQEAASLIYGQFD